ncbi:MFS transporter, FSR family, fosmidomycin resistance protein [Massilia yuzhufengensis]|uniref:MFS transporter, FSR family, fosmidomycin resistance protein n=2 Tax=Massilia yuzhufengensis TaxID=1164594 RepID=A0A1I1P414_9BURK|nr:MFS transporter [Massilia yuzhufengensis]SFD01723.1 MFS transporter, FSR family, fosmidomycin resistance protein [Massilia yuzhufengensis]
MQILFSVAFVHLLNDCVQAVLPAIYPLLKHEFSLSFTQIGLITLTFQCTASLLQPWIGLYTDKRPIPFLLPLGMCVTLGGVALLSLAGSFGMLLLAAGMIGIGSSTFHPEASRVARLASGGRFGFAQSLFQVGGNLGSAFGPLLAAAIIVGRGQGKIAWLMLLVLLAVAVLLFVSRWYAGHLRNATKKIAVHAGPGLSRGRVLWALAVLALLVFSKYIYMSSLSSYYTFYLIEKFQVSVESAQMYLFMFLAAVAAGTFAGGPIGDRIGRKRVIWVSILGAAPFTLALPYVDLFWTGVLSVIIGLVMSSAFSAIVVFAQELVPNKVGMIAGLFFGLMFGISGIGAAAMGAMADTTGIEYVYRIASFLPLLGILAILLPRTDRPCQTS